MFKREIKPLSEGMVDSIAKSINKLQYVEEKASRPADRADGDVKPQDVSGEEEVKADASATKAPARKGDQAQADGMEKVKEEVELEENMVASLAKDFANRLKKAGNSDSNQNRERMATLAMAKKKGASALDMKNLDKAMINVINAMEEVQEAYMDEKSCVGEMKKLHASSCSKMEMYKKVNEKYGCSKEKFEELYAQYCNETYGEELDPVNKVAVKKKFDDRKDKDIDNDGDTDDSDEYLHKRRKAIAQALKEKPKKSEASVDESAELEGLDENMSRVGKELEDYARKNGGIDKMDFMKAAMMMKKGQKKQLMKFVDDLDTEPREKILDLIDKDSKRRKEYKAFQKSKRNEEVELDEAKNYEYKNGKVHISKADFRKVHKDYKNTTRGKERMMVLDPKTQASVSAPVVFTEAKTDYTINHKTFSSAVQHAVDVVKKRGFDVDEDEYSRKVTMGPRKPGKGKTNRYIIALTKGGKPTRKNLHMQVYYDEGRYELNMYID